MDEFLVAVSQAIETTNDNKKVTFNESVQERTMSSRYSNCSMSMETSIDFMEGFNSGVNDLDQSFDNHISGNIQEIDRPEFSFQEPGLNANRSEHQFGIRITHWTNYA